MTSRKRQIRIHQAIAELAALFEYGALQADTDPAAFLETVALEVKGLRATLESTKEEWDTTDGAHPCWWRGHDNGARGMKAKLEKEHAQQLLEQKAQYEADFRVFLDGGGP